MVLKWRVTKDKDSQITLATAKANLSPGSEVIKEERWCTECGNAEWSIRNIKKISRIFNKGYVQRTLATIRKYKLSGFTKKQLVSLICPNSEDITDGTLQGKALAVLTSLGYLTKKCVPFVNKDGKTLEKHIYFLNEIIIPPKCYSSIKDQHVYDWSLGRTTKFYGK